MENAIKRGRRLREILKQDRLAPVSALVEMAWLVAFNDGLFDGAAEEQIGTLLDALIRAADTTTLTLDSDRTEWSDAVRRWLTESGATQSNEPPA